jgi:hypothetical protein
MKRILFAIGAMALMFAAMPAHAQTMSHEADLTYSAISCTTAQPCAPIQVYRAQCASATSCPAYAPGSTAFKALPAATVTGVYVEYSTVTATGTTYGVVDTDPALLDGTTYEWVATVAYAATPTAPSGPSNTVIGTTTAAVVTPPPVPTAPIAQGNSKVIK